MNKEASGKKSPQPWQNQKNPMQEKVGYHISDEKTIEYEAELVAFMETMANDTQQ